MPKKGSLKSLNQSICSAMATQQDTLLFIGELILAQKLDDTK